MQDINSFLKTDSINGAVGISVEVLNDFHDARAAETGEQLCLRRPITLLRFEQG